MSFDHESSPQTGYARFASKESQSAMPEVSSPASKPGSFSIHSALLSAQVVFGISAVVGAIGLPSFHPLTFALIRESCATILLLTAAHCVSLRAGRKGGVLSGSFDDLPKFLISGFGIFGSQAFYIIGIKLSSAVAASVWQPSQPIITVAACMMLGWEPFSMYRFAGIIVAFFGCAIMVLGGGGAAGEAIGGAGSGDNGAFSQLMGQVSFFMNCCGSSLYVLSSKKIINTGRYESVAVTAWSYAVASILMAIFAFVMSLSKSLSFFLCTDCGDNIWHVPQRAIPAMIFYIIMTSSFSYGLITWANKYASGTLVIGYTVTQPVASAILIQILVSFGFYKGCGLPSQRFMEDLEGLCLDLPDKFTAIGAIGVFIGLIAIIFTEPEKDLSQGDNENEMQDNEESGSLLELAERNALMDDLDERSFT